MSVQGTSRVRPASANRLSMNGSPLPPSRSCSHTYAGPRPKSTAGAASPAAPTPSSASPKTSSGRSSRSASRPAMAAPSASPPMNAHSTVVTAYTVTDSVSASARIQTTW
jgi:hypothetical protein